jgi:SAM-dependent methyltransferase
MIPIDHRKNGYALLSGDGLEIGALHEPAQLPGGARVRYLDAISETQAAELFREIPSEKLVKVDFIGDLDGGVLAQFPDGAFDFVVMNHVLEHIANPVKAVREVFRVCRKGGIVIIAIPDKDYTFDRGRDLTTWEHLWSDYEGDMRVSDDAHYESFLRSAAPHVYDEPPENLKIHIQLSRNRREHVHVWDSRSFDHFLAACFAKLGISALLRYRSVGPENHIEHFSAWQRQ